MTSTMRSASARWTAFVLATLCCMLGVSGSAAAAFDFTEFDGEATNAEGAAWTQAGAHADFEVRTFFPTTENQQGEQVPDGSVKTLSVDLPPGVVGNATTAAICSEQRLLSNPLLGAYYSNCPNDSVVGVADVYMSTGMTITLPVMNLTPAPGSAAQFGFNLYGAIVRLSASTAEAGKRIRTVVRVPQGLPMYGSVLTLWGVPADPVHDVERGGSFGICGDGGFAPCEAHREETAFMSNSTDCAAGPLTTSARANSWQEPNRFTTAEFLSHLPGGTPTGVTGCEDVPFAPAMTLRPTSRVAGAPTGAEIEVTVPQSQDPDGLASAHLKKVVAELPVGMSVNPAQANGLAACSLAQIGLGNDNPAQCPPASKLGAVQIKTPLLRDALEGSVYLAEQGSNPFNSLLALYLEAGDPARGVLVKTAGKVNLDPVSGRLTATFDQSPQSPFESLTMRLAGGDGAALVNPPGCGTYTTNAELTSWARPEEPVSSSSSFTIDQGCGKSGQFTPGFEAGTTNPVGGKFSPFTMRVTRPDGQQNVASLQTTLPKGLLAKLGGVALCPDNLAATGACPATSKVGSATVAAGSGTNPIYVPEAGKAPTALYLAGPYKGAPYSLVAMVPAQAGPFDLGTVAVRNTINVDPVSAQVSVQSDPLPQILQGIPVSYRDIRVDVDRPEFTINPTSCDPMSVGGQIASAGGASAAVSDRFQVAGCERLGFSPKLKMSLYGAPPRRGGFPALTATLTAPKGQANIGKASVLLPGTELLEQNHIRTICTRDQWASDTCPKAAIYGKAKAWTPLLDKPLEGPVYLRANGGARELPDLVADLRGQIKIELAGYIDTVKRNGVPRMRTRFLGVPDAPVAKFVLQMQGGRKGLLANNTNLCKAKPRAGVQFDGQNGKVHDVNPLVAVSGCGKKGK